jgi:hypothetical protein
MNRMKYIYFINVFLSKVEMNIAVFSQNIYDNCVSRCASGKRSKVTTENRNQPLAVWLPPCLVLGLCC